MYICICIHVYMYMCIYVNIYTCMYIYVHVCICTLMSFLLVVHVCLNGMYMYVCGCLCVCMCGCVSVSWCDTSLQGTATHYNALQHAALHLLPL